jgi:hypothetical protein
VSVPLSPRGAALRARHRRWKAEGALQRLRDAVAALRRGDRHQAEGELLAVAIYLRWWRENERQAEYRHAQRAKLGGRR